MIGKYLYASCSAKDYGRILAVGEDANGVPTIDIEVLNVGELIHYDDDLENGENHLTSLKLEGTDARLILRGVQYKMSTTPGYPDNIVCDTPGDGCYRCTKIFTLHDESRDVRWAKERN
jgi:hypothetical protein